MNKKSFFSVAFATVLLAGCATEPQILVVPSASTEIGEQRSFVADINSVADDVRLVFSAVVETSTYSYDPEYAQYFWAGEVVNDSFFAVYLVSGTGVALDADGFPVDTIELDNFVLRPGQRAAVSSYLLDKAETVEMNFQGVAAREITDRDLGSLDVTDVAFRRDGDNIDVSGFIRNTLGTSVPEMTLFAWCTDSDGRVHGVNDWRHYDPLAAGDRLPFVVSSSLDSRLSIVSCTANAVEVRPYASDFIDED